MSAEFYSELYHNLADAGLLVAVLVQLSIWLRRAMAGHRSIYPVTWTPAKRVVFTGCKVAIGLVAVTAWVATIDAIRRIDLQFSDGMLADGVALPLFGALGSTLTWLWVVTPKEWSNRGIAELLITFAVLAAIVTFLQYAPPGRF